MTGAQSLATGSRAERLWWFALACYVWLLPVGGTVAGRNVALALLLATTLHRALAEGLRLRLPLALPWLVYAGVALLSLTTASAPRLSCGEIRVEILQAALAFAIAASGVRSGTDAARLAGIVVAGNIFLVGWNIATWATGGATKDGLIGTLNTGAGDFSTYVIAVLPVIVGAAWWCRRSGRNVLVMVLLLLAAANIASLYFTLNRQAFAALLAELLVVGLWLLSRFSWKRALAMAFAIVVLGLALLGQVERRAEIGKHTSLWQTIVDDPRLPVWRKLVERVAAQPWAGEGFGQRNFPPELRLTDSGLQHPHNMILAKGLQMGLPGIAAFLLLYLSVPWQLRHGRPAGHLAAAAALAGMSMAAGVFVKNMTDDFFLRGQACLFWVLAGAMLSLARPVPQVTRRKYLVIRRDNIGDLLCTTPLITALRRRFPDAWIGVLTNSYAAPALAGNPDIDEVFVYDKGKHLGSPLQRIAAMARRIGLILRLRRLRVDVALLPAAGNQRSAERFARLSGALRIVRADDCPMAGVHEVESAFRCATTLGIDGPPPAMTLRATTAPHVVPPAGNGPLVGLHISARKPLQRWPIERFAALARRLHAESSVRFLLFWAPGAADDPRHPGDDDKAADLLDRLRGLPVTAVPTHHLAELIAGLAHCDRVICSDGGAMHIAAALGKPIVCFFGNSDAARWHPWGVRHELLQPDSRDVSDMSIDEVLAACRRLAGQ